MKLSPKKKYGAIARGMSLFVVVGLAFIHILCLVFSIYFYIHFVLNGDKRGWVLIVLSLACFIPADIATIRVHLYGRLFIKYQFYKDGIHCSGLGWGTFTVPWDSIRTYGYADNSYPTVSFQFFFFSQDPCENMKDIRSLLILRKDRLILQYRKDAWEAVIESMPIDMKRNLEDCLRHNRGGFFRR